MNLKTTVAVRDSISDQRSIFLDIFWKIWLEANDFFYFDDLYVYIPKKKL